MITVYLVGPLFTEADQVQRRKEGERLRRELAKRDVDVQIVNPIDLPLNEGGASTPAAIFEADYHFPVSYTHLDVYKRQIQAFKARAQTGCS